MLTRTRLQRREPRPAPVVAPRPAADGAVPVGMRIAGAWSWRILAIAGVVGLLVFLVIQLRYIVIPLLVAVLISALLVPLVQFLRRHRWPKWLAVTVAMVGLLAIVSGLIFLVVTQITSDFPRLRDRTVERIEEFREYLVTSPLAISEAELNQYLAQGWEALQRDTGALLTGAASVGSTAGHFLAGLLLALFATLFILIDGRGIWNWTVRLFPRRARRAVNGSGEAGWLTLTTFVKVQIFVAAVDAVGIALVAFFLGLPLVIPIAVMVFLGSFVPIVGAVVTGSVAVFIALIYQGPVAALVMLGGVLLVQQLEGHVLQPLIMGTAVKVHPLAVVVAVAAGGFIAGIPGTLFAVPIVAVLNVMVKYIASGAWRENPHPVLDDVVSDSGRRKSDV
ncbi:AI-2E family transporter [Lysobacter korlensis]|uniref:AI-2E family transporter n=1 Tax=Lysobacter korlensis TaxID=553636 RepID=A0ABV6RZV9_9GAMM